MKIISIGRFTQKLDYKTNTQNYETWTAMSEYFDEIYIVVESPDGESHFEKLGKLNVYWIPKRGRGIFGRLAFMKNAYRLSKKLICENNIDVINIGEPAVSGFPALRLKRKLRKPLVTQVQGQLLGLPAGTFSRLKTQYIEWVTKYVCKRSDRVRTVSKEILRSIVDAGVPENKVFTVPSRCNTEKFDPTKYENARIDLRASLGFSPDDIVLTFTGRLVEYRDIDSDLIALKALIDENQRFKMLIVGDGAHQEALEKMSCDLAISEYTRFVGRVPFDEIPAYLSAGDIFISTPTNEGIARSVLEAMSMQLPTVATRVGGTPELIVNHENGILVDVKSPEQIVAAVKFITSSENKRLEMGRKAREAIINKHEFHKLIADFAHVHFDID